MFSQASVCSQGCAGVYVCAERCVCVDGRVCVEGCVGVVCGAVCAGGVCVADGHCHGRYTFFWKAFLFGIIVAENCTKMKKSGPRWSARVPLTP